MVKDVYIAFFFLTPVRGCAEGRVFLRGVGGWVGQDRQRRAKDGFLFGRRRVWE